MAIAMLTQVSQAAESFESKACRSATITMVQNSKELVISSFELKGILQSNTNAEILNNVSRAPGRPVRCSG
jgi:hypothetical protein